MQKQSQKQNQQQNNQASSSGGGETYNYGSSDSGVGPDKSCAPEVQASSATSCEFAMNVAGEHGSNYGASSIRAYSQVTREYYTMNCSAWSGGGTVCRDGNNAAVFLP